MPVVGTDQTSPPLDKLRALVRNAFEVARESGRADWQVMTTAVLKNRILDATAREFDERDYGATSIVEAVRLIPETVDLDETARPPRVTLCPGAVADATDDHAGQTLPAVSAGRVRPDLWDAVLDYSSPGVMVWDGSKAVRVQEDQVGGRPLLPTISADDMAGWRREFATQNVDHHLDEWAGRGLGTLALPADLRSSWNQFIKSNALAILADWFQTQGLEMPADTLVSSATKPADTLVSSASKRPPSAHADAEELRRFLLRCVAVMKPSELAAVQIPASVALRAKA